MHLNRYDVIYINMTDVMEETTAGELVPFIKRSLSRELKRAYPDVLEDEGFAATLVNAVEIIGNRFI